MSVAEKSGDVAGKAQNSRAIELNLEAFAIPVADVDRAKKFYGDLGWRLDADFPFDNGFRVVQFTPPGSDCSIQFGTKLTSAVPGSAQGLYLVVSDIETARAALAERGIKISDVFHITIPGAQFQLVGNNGRVNGPAPGHDSCRSYATFSDPDGNSWFCRRSRSGYRDALTQITVHSPPHPILQGRFDERLPHTASMKSGSERPIRRAGPSGTPNTSLRSAQATHCRPEEKEGGETPRH